MDLVRKMENTQHHKSTTWMQKRVEISFGENLTGHQSLLKIASIIVASRDEIGRPTLVGDGGHKSQRAVLVCQWKALEGSLLQRF